MMDLLSMDVFESQGRKVFVVRNPSECLDFSHLIGQRAKIDGEVCVIIGVERRTHSAPWKKGEPIGLLTDISA